MAKSQRIVSRRVERELLKHPKQWAALSSSRSGQPYDRIIAFGPDPKTVFAAAEAAGVECPLLWYVPDPNISYYFAAGALPASAV